MIRPILISLIIVGVSCSGSKESLKKDWTFDEAWAVNQEQIKSLDQNPIEDHEWVTIQECEIDQSTFAVPEIGIRNLFQKIDYPAELRRERIQGNVKARILIDEHGSVTGLNFVSNTDRRLNNEVRKVLRRTNYVPAFCNKVPVASKQTMTVNYRIQGM